MRKNFIYHKRKAYSSTFCHSMQKYFEENSTLHQPGRVASQIGPTLDIESLKDKEITLDISGDWWNIKGPLSEGIVEYKKIYPGLDTSVRRWSLFLTCQLMKYEPGDAYWQEHYENDGYGHISERLMGWMIYLNDIQEGGGTMFTQQNFIARPREGDLYIWPAAWTHLHKGIVAPKEYKYIITGWCNYLDEK